MKSNIETEIESIDTIANTALNSSQDSQNTLFTFHVEIPFIPGWHQQPLLVFFILRVKHINLSLFRFICHLSLVMGGMFPLPHLLWFCSHNASLSALKDHLNFMSCIQGSTWECRMGVGRGTEDPSWTIYVFLLQDEDHFPHSLMAKDHSLKNFSTGCQLLYENIGEDIFSFKEKQSSSA